MEIPIRKKKFIAVEYPGIVHDHKKMLKTLGGETNINQVFNTVGQRLELRYRPEDIYCKPACANKHATTSLVLKVRRVKITDPQSQQVQHVYEGEVLGIVGVVYKFTNLVDFQYLPMVRKESTMEYTSLHEKLCLNSIQPSSWIKKKVPLHLPPTLFSRIDNPTDYNYRDGPYKSTPVHGAGDDPNVISVSRQRRPHFTRIVLWENWEVPTEPNPQALRKVYKKATVPIGYEKLKQMFVERPVWSRTALVMSLDHTPDHLKFILPSIAYYILTGPWRRVWVRFGYDPRAHTAAKIYQVVDFRIKDKSLSGRLGIQIKRSSTCYRLPNKMTKTQAITPKIKQAELNTDLSATANGSITRTQKDSYYKFYPGIVPAYHQICYQYCDLEEPVIQKLIHRNDGQELECSEKDGWCLPNTTENIRRIILDHLYAIVREKDRARGVSPSEYSRYSATTLGTNLNDYMPDTSSSLADANEEVINDEMNEDEDLNSEEEEILAEEGGTTDDEVEDG